jgi:hypothetical protein
VLQKQCTVPSDALYVVRFKAAGSAICTVPAYDVPQVPERRRQVLQRQMVTRMGSKDVSSAIVVWKEVQAHAAAIVVAVAEAMVN